MDRHLDTEDIWFAHDYVPFDQGENFAFLGGRDWDPSQVTLPRTITDACEILLITQGQPLRLPPRAGRALHPRGVVGPLAGPVDRRGAPARDRAARIPGGDPRGRPDRQRGGPGPARDEGLPRRHVLTDRDAGVHGARRAHPRGLLPPTWPRRSRSRSWPDSSSRIARDEERHELFFANLVAHCLEYRPATRRSPRSPRAPRTSRWSAPTSTPTRTRCRTSPTQAFSTPAELRQAISDRITAWGLADEPRAAADSSLAERRLGAPDGAAGAATRVASHVMAQRHALLSGRHLRSLVD